MNLVSNASAGRCPVILSAIFGTERRRDTSGLSLGVLYKDLASLPRVSMVRRRHPLSSSDTNPIEASIVNPVGGKVAERSGGPSTRAKPVVLNSG